MSLTGRLTAQQGGDHEIAFDDAVRTKYRSMAFDALAFAHITLAGLVAIFWVHVDASNLLLWAGVQSLLLLLTGSIAFVAPPGRFVPLAVTAEMISSVWWAALALIAPAADSDWQTMQGMILIGLMLATLANSTASRRLHLARTVPLAFVGAITFAVTGTGAAQWVCAGFAIGLPFTIAAGSDLRNVEADLFASSQRNERLATSLRAEGERLQTANAQLEERSQRDVLTGLYNRAGFLPLLNEAVDRLPGRIVVCYVDLDGFKRVNDAFGHRFGDQILCSAAARISNVLLPNEILARQGGDELTIFTDIEDLNGDVEDLGKRILSVFSEPFLIEKRQIEVGVSIGLVWVAEQASAGDLMRFADTALYRAKDNGKGRYEVFDDTMRAELDALTELQGDLGRAFQRSEIAAYLQPIVEINTGRIASAEALARWEHEDGVRTAADFIDAARDLGVLDRINDAVVQRVFAFQRSMQLGGTSSCPITVNVSPIHLDAMLHRVLAEPSIDPVIFEITEDGIFSDLDGARRLLDRARNAGIEVLLDDFGVGFSSLSIATELPVDGFKIDRGFVASLAGNPSALAAVEAIIQLADRMGLRVIAEGVETIEQLKLLQDLGVGYAQGYLFSPAVEMNTFAEWLASGLQFDVCTSPALTT